MEKDAEWAISTQLLLHPTIQRWSVGGCGNLEAMEVVRIFLSQARSEGYNEAIAEAVKMAKEASYGGGTPETEEYSGCYLYDIDIAEKLSALVKK